MRDNISFNHNFEFITALLAAYKRHYNDESLDFVECSNTKYVNDFIALIGDKYKTIMEYLKAGYTNDCGDISYLSMSLNEDFSINKEMVDKYQINEKLSCGNINDLSQKLSSLSTEINYNEYFKNNEWFYDTIINELYKVLSSINYSKVYDFYNSKNNKELNFILSGFINGGFSCTLENEVFSIAGLKVENGKYITDNYCCIRNFHEYSHSEINPLVDKYYNLFDNVEMLKNDAIINGLPSCYADGNFAFLYEYFVRANAYVLAMEYLDDKTKTEELDYYESIGFRYIRSIVEIILLKKKNYNTYEEFFVKELIPLLNDYSDNLFKSNSLI